jgi:hypothetical protein
VFQHCPASNLTNYLGVDMADKSLTQEALKKALHYDPETGHFTWLIKSSPVRLPGTRAGGNDGKGYVMIGLYGKNHKAGWLAWFYVHGVWPQMIDHINGNPSDNSIGNLREVTYSQNNWNKRISKRNTSGYVGVHWSKRWGKWVAVIVKDRKSYFLGKYSDPAIASQAYQQKAVELFGEYHRYHANYLL